MQSTRTRTDRSVDSTVLSAIDRYRSPASPDEAVQFAKEVVARSAPTSSNRARSLLWCCAKLATFGLSVGLDATPTVLLHPSVIERFVVVGANSATSAARRTLRTNLRFVAHRVVPELNPVTTSLPRERAKSPYTAAEIAAYLALADAQPTKARAMRTSGLICLGAGAGLMGADLRHIRGTDVHLRSGGLVVVVGGARPRVVPVLARFHEELLASVTFAGAGLVVGGLEVNRRNVTTPLVSSITGGMDLARLDTSRLRVTWLATCAEALGINVYLAAAGITCSQRLGDIVATIDDVDEVAAVALLGGTSSQESTSGESTSGDAMWPAR